MINTKQLVDEVIEPTLTSMKLYSPEAVQLLLGTAAVESKLGYYIKQIQGPARGIYQVEPATARWLIKDFAWVHRFSASSDRKSKQRGFHWYSLMKHFLSDPKNTVEDQLVWNLVFQTMICRLRYYVDAQLIPKTIDGQASYWKRVYNTRLGKGTPKKYKLAWKEYVKSYRVRGAKSHSVTI